MAPSETALLKLPTAVPVECYSGYTYAERPIAFVWEGKRHKVERVVKQWHTPHGTTFQVLTAAGSQCTLTYHEFEDEWILLLVEE